MARGDADEDFDVGVRGIGCGPFVPGFEIVVVLGSGCRSGGGSGVGGVVVVVVGGGGGGGSEGLNTAVVVVELDEDLIISYYISIFHSFIGR